MDNHRNNQSHKIIKTTIVSIVANIFLSVIKGISGVIGNSYALIADAIESLTDVFTSILVYLGAKYAQRPADENHPYGHGRIEPLVTFVIVFFLLLSSLIIAYQSIININTPHSLPSPWLLILLLLIIIWKEISYRFVIKKSKETNSSSLKADAWHHRSDAITSLAAFIGISFSLFMGEGYEAADDWAALFASFIIIYNAYKIFRPAFSEIMDEHLYDGEIHKIREIASKVSGVVETEKCFVRKIGIDYFVDLHVHVDGDLSVREGHTISHHVKDRIIEEFPQVYDVLIHIEPD